jgi:GTP cyclohydrolase II
MSLKIAAEGGTDPAPMPTGVTYVTSCDLPTPWATFRLHAFIETATGTEHLALALGDVDTGAPVLARLHSECLTGDALFSQRCDCGAQLETALRVGKLRAYHLQDQGADTVEANQALGFAPDQRHYRMCLPMLTHLGISSLRLMTNNPRKIAALEELGIVVAERIALHVERNRFNRRYLQTKAAKLGHIVDPAVDTTVDPLIDL